MTEYFSAKDAKTNSERTINHYLKYKIPSYMISITNKIKESSSKISTYVFMG